MCGLPLPWLVRPTMRMLLVAPMGPLAGPGPGNLAILAPWVRMWATGSSTSRAAGARWAPTEAAPGTVGGTHHLLLQKLLDLLLVQLPLLLMLLLLLLVLLCSLAVLERRLLCIRHKSVGEGRRRPRAMCTAGLSPHPPLSRCCVLRQGMAARGIALQRAYASR